MTTKDIRKNFPIYHTNWLNRIVIIDAIQSAANEYAKGLLLDVGCGAKPYRDLFANKVVLYLGLDLRFSNPRSSEVRPDTLASALTLPLPDNLFDTIVSFQVLEHVPEPQVMFAEMFRVLKPDGYLILMAPQMWHLHEIPHDYFRYTRYGLTHLAERAGFTVEYIQPLSGFWIRAGLVMSYRIYQIFSGRSVRELWVTNIVIHGLIVASNFIFCTIDRLWPRLSDPINNLLVAKKCKWMSQHPQ